MFTHFLCLFCFHQTLVPFLHPSLLSFLHLPHSHKSGCPEAGLRKLRDLPAHIANESQIGNAWHDIKPRKIRSNGNRRSNSSCCQLLKNKTNRRNNSQEPKRIRLDTSLDDHATWTDFLTLNASKRKIENAPCNIWQRRWKINNLKKTMPGAHSRWKDLPGCNTKESSIGNMWHDIKQRKR